jgi:hypothetical protein
MAFAFDDDEVEMIPLSSPIDCGKPLLACMLSGRVIYGNNADGDRPLSLKSCVDYLP